MSKGEKARSPRESTLAALLEGKPKRGRPRSAVPRQSVYVALTDGQKHLLTTIGDALPADFSRADIPDMAVALLSARLDQVRQAVADRDRDLPEGITDIESLYFLWDLVPPPAGAETKWTSVRLSPQQVVQFGRLQGILKALFGSTRSDVFALALALLASFAAQPQNKHTAYASVRDFDLYVQDRFLS